MKPRRAGLSTTRLVPRPGRTRNYGGRDVECRSLRVQLVDSTIRNNGNIFGFRNGVAATGQLELSGQRFSVALPLGINGACIYGE